MTEALSVPLAQALGLALVHFVWQGAAIGLTTALLLALLRRGSADVRYLIACLGMAALATAPIATVVEVWPHEKNGTAVGATLAVPVTPSSGQLQEITVAADVHENDRAAVVPYLPTILVVWAVGVLALSVRLARGYIGVTRLRHREGRGVSTTIRSVLTRLASELGVRRRLLILESSLVEVPTVIGWLRPTILMPASALSGLSLAQLEAILAHEVAHIRRHDYLVNGLQTMVETALFYHPAVWWVSSAMRREREHCCDDLAIAVVGNRVVYAGALASLEEARQQPAFGLAATDGDLLARVRRVLGSNAPVAQPLSIVPVALVLAALSAASLVARSTTSPDIAPTSPIAVAPVAQPPVSFDARTADFLMAGLGADEQGGTPADARESRDESYAELRAQYEALVAQGRAARESVQAAQLRDALDRYARRVPAAPTENATSLNLEEQQIRPQAVPATTWEVEVRELEERYRVAKLRNDLSTLELLLDDNYVGTNQNGNTRNKVGMLELFATFPIRSIVQNNVEVRATFERAIVTGTMVETNQTGIDAMLFTRVWVRSGNTWQLLSGTQFRDPRRAVVFNPRLEEGVSVAGGPAVVSPAPVAPVPVARNFSGVQAVRVGGNIQEPRKIRDVRPIYPRIAHESGVSGVVILEAVIDVTGAVADARILRGHPMLNAAALDAVTQWQYTPSMLNGVPTQVIMTVTVNFQMPVPVAPIVQ